MPTGSKKLGTGNFIDGIKLIFASDSEVKNIPDLIELINKTQPESVTMTPSRFLSYLEIDDFCDSIKSFKATCFSSGIL